MIDLSIVIVGTNEKKFVDICLKSIGTSKIPYSFEIILVDNASTDGTAVLVKEQYPHVQLIINKKKLGYIHNNVVATRLTKGRYVLLLNSDIEVQTDTIAYMMDFMERHPKVSVSGCKLVFDDGTLQLTCRQFPTPLTYLSRLPHFFRWVKSAKRFSWNTVVEEYLS